MSIPSAVLAEEIKQKGFSEVPFENVYGEICIGYGHRILNNPDLLNSHDSDLAQAIKLYDGNGFYDLKDGVVTDYQKNLHEKVLDCGLRIDEEKAQELLIYDIGNNFEELTRKSSAFRHLTNMCGGDGCFLPNTQMSIYYKKLKMASQSIFEENSPMHEHFDAQLCEDLAEDVAKHLEGHLEENSAEDLAQKADSQFTQNFGEHLGEYSHNYLTEQSCGDSRGHVDTFLEIPTSSGEHFKRPPAYNKDARTVRFALLTSSQNEDFTSQNSLSAVLSTSSNTPLNVKDMASASGMASANDINSAPNASKSLKMACANNPYNGEYTASRLAYEKQSVLAYNNIDGVLESVQQKLDEISKSKNLKKSKKSKKKNLEFFGLPHSVFESALIRLDTVMYLTHLIGVKKVLEMKAVLACIRMDDFMSAAGYMLSNSWGGNFGEIAVILSRRMRYGLMVSRVDEEIPEHLKQDFEDESLVEKETEKEDENFGFYDQMPNESQGVAEVAHS